MMIAVMMTNTDDEGMDDESFMPRRKEKLQGNPL
jgi:hypothetical protein